MSIQISGCTVIDNSRNITNANNMCVGVVTMTGSSGDIETPGTVTVGGLDFPPSAISFSPADGATGVEPNVNIVITFNQFVEKATTGIGTTANITLRNSSGIGTVIQTIGVSSTSVQINGAVVTIDPPSFLSSETNIYVVVDASAFVDSFGGNNSLINTYDFTTRIAALGEPFEGGFLICCASSVKWIVSSRCAEVSRSWYARSDSDTRAQEVSGCTGWFVPTIGQLQNPGFTCRTFWDSFSAALHWSSSDAGAGAWRLNMSTGTCYAASPPCFNGFSKLFAYCVRSFRCVTY